jgi:hypothetical protein
LICMRKSRGPSIEPWETPMFYNAQLEYVLLFDFESGDFIYTCCLLSWRYDLNHWPAKFQIP